MPLDVEIVIHKTLVWCVPIYMKTGRKKAVSFYSFVSSAENARYVNNIFI
jgi:hypothetical protein